MLIHRFEMPGRLVHTLFKIICDDLKLSVLHFSSITGEFVRDSLVGVGEEWLRVEGHGYPGLRVEGRGQAGRRDEMRVRRAGEGQRDH